MTDRRQTKTYDLWARFGEAAQSAFLADNARLIYGI